MAFKPVLLDTIDLFQIHERGRTTTISFVDEEYSIADEAKPWLSALQQILQETKCHHLVFDLTGFESPSSSVLALFVWPIRSGVKVTLCNPSPHLSDIVERTRLADVVGIIRPTRSEFRETHQRPGARPASAAITVRP